MLTLEFISRIASLDLQWFVQLFLDNLVLAFIFLVITFIFNEMKFSPKIFVVLSVGLIVAEEFLAEMGIIWLVGGFLFVYYISEFVVLTFAESIPKLKNRLPLVETIFFFSLLAVYFVFLGGG